MRQSDNHPAAGLRATRGLWLWVLASAVAYLVFALAQPAGTAACGSVTCAGGRGFFLVLGLLLGLPCVLILAGLGHVAIRLAARRIHAGVLMGTAVAWACLGVTALAFLASLNGP